MKKSYRLFELILAKEGLQYVTEYRFHPTRKWRADYAFIDANLLVEVEGGLWIGGRHNRPISMIKDFEKYNSATMIGWSILKFTPSQLNECATIDMIKEFVNQRIDK